jgi:hypothetical protein
MNSLVNIVYNTINDRTLTNEQKISIKDIILDASKVSHIKEGVDYVVKKTDSHMDLTFDISSYGSDVHLKLYEAITNGL